MALVYCTGRRRRRDEHVESGHEMTRNLHHNSHPVCGHVPREVASALNSKVVGKEIPAGEVTREVGPHGDRIRKGKGPEHDGSHAEDPRSWDWQEHYGSDGEERDWPGGVVVKHFKGE